MDKHTERKLLTVSSAVVMILAAASAAAQDSATTDLGTVFVTAQKRAENQQDVPVSISVVKGSDLADMGAANLSDYTALVPGLQIDNNGAPGTSTISLRGIGPLGSSATVGIYLDDAPIGSGSIYNSTAILSLELLPDDLERIEVLRGPQGTLYGASSIGGLFKYVTLAPSLDELTGHVGVETYYMSEGSGSPFAVNARVSFPLVTDKLGLSLSYANRELPAYIDNVTTGQDDVNEGSQEGARLALRWEPSETTSVTLSAMRQEVDSDDNGTLLEDGTGTPIGDGFSTNNLRAEPFESQYDNLGLSVNFDLGFATLTSVTTWTETEILRVLDASNLFGLLIGGLSDISYTFDQEKLTQEVRLTSPTDERFEWLAGVYYTDEDNEVGQIVSGLTEDGEPMEGLNPLAVVQLPNTYTEHAIFGNATWKFSDRFHLSAGLRWAENDQDFRQISFGAVVPTADVPGTSKEDVITYSFSPQFHLNNDTMVYARAATGYRAGGPNVFLPDVPPTVESDEMTSYEIGIKSNLSDGQVQLELAAFYMDWEDIQLAVLFENGTGGLANAGSARSQGVEGSLRWAASDRLLLGLNGAYSDAQLTSDTPETVGGFDGDRLPRTPEWSGAATADYSFEVGNLEVRFGGALRYVGDRLSAVESSPSSIEADAYTQIDLHASVAINDRWTVRVYGRNVTDADGAISRELSPGNPGFIATVPIQPATIGFGVDVNF